MNFSPNNTNVAKAYVQARSQLQSVSKDKQGRVGNQNYKYATLDSILLEINSLLAQFNCVLFLEVLGNENSLIYPSATNWKKANEDKTAVYLPTPVGVRCTIMHESGEYLSGDTFWFNCTVDLAQASPSPAQQLGIWVTYMKRYALGGFMGLPLDEDTDGSTTKTDGGTTSQANQNKQATSQNKGNTGQATKAVTPPAQQTQRLYADGTTLANPTLNALYDNFVQAYNRKPANKVELQNYHKQRQATQ